MKHIGVVALLVVAVGLLGLAPVAVCEMPPDCPMQQPSGHHVCCQPAVPSSADGMAAAPCHAVTVVSSPATISQGGSRGGLSSLPSAPSISLPVILSDVRPSTWLRTNGAEDSASPVPRFLLTHTFRL